MRLVRFLHYGWLILSLVLMGCASKDYYRYDRGQSSRTTKKFLYYDPKGRSSEEKEELVAAGYNIEGVGYARNGQYEQAIASYNKAIQLDPDLDSAYYNRSLAWESKGQLNKALYDVEQYLKLNPNDDSALERLINLRLRTKLTNKKVTPSLGENQTGNLPKPKQLSKTTKDELYQKRPIYQKDTSSSEVLHSSSFGRYYALVIGNNNYHSLPKLKTSINDAKAVADILRNRYGFTVQILTDANRADIILALGKFRNNLTKRDNLLIYYAGHGWLDIEADENSSLTGAIRAILAKHVLIVADSCYSGKLARGIHLVRRTPDYFSRIAQKKARSVLSSGGLEPVLDSGGGEEHSVFASAFLDALEENKGMMDGTELFSKIRRPVMLNSDQTPEYSDIRKAGHDGGDFIFLRRGVSQ
jgi:tetratricopeptide (TPR) repeat protein